MTNPNFVPTYSTNEIWRNLDIERCLTDDLDAIDATFSSLSSTYAAKNHTHTGYATADDVGALQDALNNKANANHTHTEYALSTHNHDGSYYKKSEVDSALSEKAGSATVTSHTENADIHTTAAKKANWDSAYSHSQAAHAPSNAEANQNAFSNVKIGNSTVSAGAKTDTFTIIAGNNVTLTPNADGKSVAIASKDTVYTHPTSTGSKHIPVGGSSGQILKWSSDGTAAWGDENHSADNITSGTLPVERGGTGATSTIGFMENIGLMPVTSTGTGAAYVASVNGITELVAGVSFVMVPHVMSTTQTPTLNVNGLGAKSIRRRLSNSTSSTVPGGFANWLGAGKPIKMIYDGRFWLADFTKPSAADIYGVIDIDGGGTGANNAADARANLDVYSKAEVEALIAQALANR